MNTGVPMAEVAVVTNSCASIPEYLLEHLRIRTVAYYIHRGQAYQQMANMVVEVVGKSEAKIAYVHVGMQCEVERLRELVEAKVNVVESFVGELSPALAVHSGPGTTGLCYYPVES